jgi:hypothetical protein
MWPEVFAIENSGSRIQAINLADLPGLRLQAAAADCGVEMKK